MNQLNIKKSINLIEKSSLIKENLSNNLKHLRKINKLSQKSLAKLTSSTRSKISNYESGNNAMPITFLLIVSALFNVSVYDLCLHRLR